MTNELAKFSGSSPRRQLLAGRSTPEHMALGAIAPDTAEIENLVSQRRATVHYSANLMQDPQRRADFLAQHDLLMFDHYQRAIGIAVRQRQDPSGAMTLKDGEGTPAVWAFLHRYNPKFHTADVVGWVQYIADASPPLADVIAKLGSATRLPADAREGHTLITAKSKWGKSELVKALVHHYVEHDSAGVVVLDPHGDMSAEIAMWPEFVGSDRLVYVEPGLEPGRTVGLNLFDTTGLAEDEIADYADHLGTALSEITSQLTPHMETVARASARLLLEDGNATLFDLLDLLTNPPSAKERREDSSNPFLENRARLIAKGQAHPDRAMRWYFCGGAESDSFKSSREGVNKRIIGLLLLPQFQAMTCGRSTINLQSLLDQRKVIVFNLLALGTTGAAVMGRMVLALLTAMAKRRRKIAKPARVPCHVFVDEAQTLASPSMSSILFECRKFGVHLTLAQQAEKVAHDEDGQQALTHSILVRMAGTNLKSALRGVFEDQPIPDGEPLTRHEFWTRWGDAKPVRLHVTSDFVASAPERSSPEWLAMVAQQRPHYRATHEETPASAITSAAVAGSARPAATVVDEWPLV